jgi:peptidoglycan/LPS O-acetylase OafA/YrhL
LAIAVVVITLFVPQAPTRRGEKYGRIWPLRALSFVYPAMLCMLVVANPQRSFPASGALAVLILAVLSVVLTAWTYSDTGKHTLPYPFVVAAIAALGLIAWGRDRPDLQLFIALAGGVLVVVPSIVEELLHRSASARAAPP